MHNRERLGRYRIVRELGRGGMGVVYQAEDEMLARTVALKTLAVEQAGRNALRERLLREARLSARLDHPNVIRLHDIGSEDGLDFLVLEFVDGQTLRDLLGTAPLRLGEALRIFRDVAEGVSHAHGLGIIHRDLKPENVMVTPDGRAKVMDFGLAWQSSQMQLTRTGAMMGTMAYFSPEQARGETADARSDLYSLGAILYELLAGDLVFNATSPAEMIMHHLHSPPPSLPPSVPAALDAMVQRCLQKDPARRYQTVRALIDALSPLLADSPRLGTAPPPRPMASMPTPVMPTPQPTFQPPAPVEAPPPGAWSNLHRMMALMNDTNVIPTVPIDTNSISRRSDLPAAESIEKKEVLRDSATFDTEYRKGKEAMEAGRLDEAIDHLLTAARLRASDARPYLYLAISYQQQKRPEAAVEACRSGLKLDPNQVRLRARLAEFLARGGQLAAGISEGEAAVKLRPDLTETWKPLARLYLQADRVTDAVRAHEELVRIDPRDVSAMPVLASLYLRQGKADKAEATARRALRLAPRDAHVQIELAKALEAQNQPVAAVQLLQEAVQAEPDALPAWERLVALHLKAQHTLAAQAVLEDALYRHPRASRLLWQQGELQLAEGLSSQAAAAFDRAIDGTQPMQAALQRLNDSGSDMATLARQVARHPQDVGVRTALGRIYLRQGQASSAQEVLQDGLVQVPGDMLLNYLMGQAQRHRGQLDAAIRCFRLAWERCSK